MAYIGVSPSSGVRRVHTYTATASQTTFSGAGAEGTSLSYKDSNFVDVYQNGIKLGDADYTSTSGTSIVLAQGASVDDLVVVVVFDVFSVADTVSKADGGTFDGNVTMAGTLDVTGNGTVGGTLGVTGNQTNSGSVTITGDLASSTSGTSNFRAGVNAGNSIQSGGNYNTAVGDEAGTGITTGDSNSLLGYQAGDSITEGSSNVAIGGAALSSLTTNGANTVIGATAGTNLTSADNTFVGKDSGYYVTSGAKNTILGKFAGNSDGLDIRTSSNNIVISDGDGDPKMFHTTAYGTNGTFYIGNLTNSSYWPKVSTSSGQNAVTFDGGAGQVGLTSDGTPMWMNRNNTDGDLIKFYAQGNNEGNISVSGTTVTYGGGHLGRWSQLSDSSKDTKIVKGTVMTNLDQMCVWKHEAIKVGDNEYNEVGELIGKATEAKDAYTEDNEQLNCMAVSNVEGDANVAGVFVKWDNDDDGFNDMMVAMTGDMVIRIAKGTTVARGDLLMSAGDGTAKPQGDDIVRSKTIAKVTSTNVSHTYDDGTYLVPCVLMAC